MHLDREISQLMLGLLLVFSIITLSAAYWAVIGPDTIARRDDNPRNVEAELAIVRGQIADRGGTTLVQSDIAENGQVTREYLYPFTSAITGYASPRYGVGGAEAAYNDLLRGDLITREPLATIADDLLHRPRHGADIQITLDLALQRTASEQLADQTGAIVVLGVPDGEVLALVSQPTFNPNTLDTDWDQLVRDPSKPFFNRALQGRYQPGSTLQTMLIAAALLTDHPLENAIPDATNPVQIDSAEIGCAIPFAAGNELTLRQAYAFACPAPFAGLVDTLGAGTIQAALNTFFPDQRARLPGFATEPEIAFTRPENGDTSLVEEALGQGERTVSPLAMAMMAAAIINDGNAPQPSLLLATREPDTANWDPVSAVPQTVPFSTVDTARQLQDLMREAVAQGAASNAGRPGMDIGGHAGLAYSGTESLAWFIGFTTLGGDRAVAVAVVLEASNDPGLAADIGGSVLRAAHEALQPA